MIRLLPITAARSQPLRRARPAGRPAGLTAALAASTVTAAAIALAAAVLPAQAATLPARTGGHPAAAISHHPARGGQHPARSRMRAACGQARPGHARCLALYQPEVTVNAAIAAGASGLATQPQGWGPRAIESAYKLPAWRRPHQTVAVVDAMSTPHLAADLAIYRKHYGLR